MPSTVPVMLRRVCILIAAAASSFGGVNSRWACAQSDADLLAATASSEWGAGYGAAAAADGIANENGNYWQTIEKQDRDAWWRVDLGQVVLVRGIKIAWACYEDKHHAPPARVIVQLSTTGIDGSWEDVLTFEADRIPADESPFEPAREWVDDNLHTIIGTRFYLLHSADLDFVRQSLPALERMLTYFAQRRDPQGLFKLDDVGAHWYYHAITTSGVNGYYNAFFYKAACDLAEMERAAGRDLQAREYGTLAASIKAAFNRVFWKEDAPGGPRYLDWIDA